jgi:next-to-BRCA1 protein 1
MDKSVADPVCNKIIDPGEEFGFSMWIKTPPFSFGMDRVKASFRLMTPSGEPFGHRLWCDINIMRPS